MKTTHSQIRKRRIWSREETIVAFNLYCKLPFNKVNRFHPEVIKLANQIGRPSSSVGMKIGNIGRLDPELQKKGITGLPHGALMETEVWEEFNGDWDSLAYESERLLRKYNKEQEIVLDEEVEDIPLPIGADKTQAKKARVNQNFFRVVVLSAYDNKCCVSGIDATRLLIASHIKPWKDSDPKTERTNPRNGLCLCSLYDKAFDVGLMTIDSSYRIVLSKSLKDALPHDVVHDFFLRYEGKFIALPQRFKPLKESLVWHNERVFIA
ncbi:MAG: HNH endonuclease [Kiritimatiellaeota bacterium]|nr:HNH endonuclease [Kiritimatiellota bacterium]